MHLCIAWILPIHKYRSEFKINYTYPPIQGWAPTESWASLLNTICLKFLALDVPMIAILPPCINKAPSPFR